MAGINQLPAGAEGVAAFALIYSSISWICSVLLIWCARLYHEAWSYISLLAYFALVSNTASIIQQAHDITWYRDILTEQFRRKTTFLENPELAISNGSYGLDLGLYYLQYYSYNVEAMLVMFWAFELAQSVYGLSAKPHLKVVLRRINGAGKAVAVLFPIITILLLRAPAVQHVFVAFILLADLPLMISLAVSSMTMVAILIRYIQSRKKISNWTPQGGGTTATNETSTETVQTTTTEETGTNKKSQRKQGLYDRWLMVRFTVAFVILAVFEVTNTLFQLQSVSNNNKDSTLTSPDYSLERARSTFFLFLPGVTPGLFLFLVFGTTAGCRTALKNLFMPTSWKAQTPGGKKRGSAFSRKSKTTDPEHQSEDPFADSTEANVKPIRRLTNPLPVATLVSKYNRKHDANHEQIQYSRALTFSSKGERIPDEVDEMELRGITVVTTLEQVREGYYQPSPEQSDDSGPILPIMSPQQKCTPGNQKSLPPVPPSRTRTPNVGK